MGGRNILTRKDIERCFYEKSKVLFITKDTIILPGAQDLIKSTDIKIVRVDDDGEMKGYLKECFEKNGITDEEVCNRIVEKIKEKLTEKRGEKLAIKD
ncbi:MAG: hypothetical protein L5655_08355 [Thermosediminibacteraceae bacterium]|nr:hypothetical protein [Thermosediminibacteraceae bacterium]